MSCEGQHSLMNLTQAYCQDPNRSTMLASCPFVTQSSVAAFVLIIIGIPTHMSSLPGTFVDIQEVGLFLEGSQYQWSHCSLVRSLNLQGITNFVARKERGKWCIHFQCEFLTTQMVDFILVDVQRGNHRHVPKFLIIQAAIRHCDQSPQKSKVSSVAVSIPHI